MSRSIAEYNGPPSPGGHHLVFSRRAESKNSEKCLWERAGDMTRGRGKATSNVSGYLRREFSVRLSHTIAPELLCFTEHLAVPMNTNETNM